MSDVASLEFCRELYAVSGWTETSHWYDNFVNGKWHVDTAAWPVLEHERENIVPAYDLGYLLRKLSPLVAPDGDHCIYMFLVGGMYTAEYQVGGGHRKEWIWDADNPEDAAAKLAIELIKQNIITANQRERHD